MPSETVEARPDWRLDAVFVVVLVALAGGARATGWAVGPIKPGLPDVLMTLYVLGLGVLFVLSYFFPDKSYSLRALMWFSRNVCGKQGAWMAIVWGILAIGLGLGAVLLGLGVVHR